MNLRRQHSGDSLDMLLDTMCNTFGGIILLAVLVTLLTSREEKEKPATTSGTQEMIHRRLVTAQFNLQQSIELQKQLEIKAKDERWKAKVSLISTRRNIQDEINTIRKLSQDGIIELDASKSIDPAERMKSLNNQLSEVQRKHIESQNNLVTSQDNLKRLKIRLTSLEEQVFDTVKKSQRQLRLPKEHETGKRVTYIIIRFGRLYPCRDIDYSRNEVDLEWTSKNDGELAEPIAGKGIDPNNEIARFKAYLNNLSENSVYIAFCVYADSFPAFIQAKQLTLESGLSFGWEPFRLSQPVIFSSVGHTPKPQ